MIHSRILFFAISCVLLACTNIWFADAQTENSASSCVALIDERNEKSDAVEKEVQLKQSWQRALTQTQTASATVADQNLAKYTKWADGARAQLQRAEGAQQIQYWRYVVGLYESGVDFWRSKRTEIASGGVLHVGGGDTYVATIRQKIEDTDKDIRKGKAEVARISRELAQCRAQEGSQSAACSSPVGSWNWWNGGIVTFSAGGTAKHPQSSGNWETKSPGHWHVHWERWNSDDYFTLSADGKTMSGTFNGSSGTSTRIGGC